MASEIRTQKLSLEKDLQDNAKSFSFEMAAYILEHKYQISFGEEINLSDAPFKTQSINSFHLRGTEIEKISEINGIKTIYIERLALSGLNAPLATPYAELIFRRNLEKDIAMTEFLNAFNMRLLGISYQISKRRYLNLQNHKKTNCLIIRTIAAFLGESPHTMNRKLSRLSYLFWTKEKSAAGLEAVITSLFQFEANIIEFCSFWASGNEISPLGQVRLGKNSGLGKKISISSFGLQIQLTHDNYNEIFRLLTCIEHSNSLKFIIQKYLGDFFYYKILLTPKKVPNLQIGHAILGKTSWIPGEKLDSAKIVC